MGLRYGGQMTRDPLAPRLAALVVMIAAMGSLRLQFDAMEGLPGMADASARIWWMAGYFTVLTNALVAVTMMAAALRFRIGAVWMAALTVSISVVGIVYHVVLARLWVPEGLAFWADQGMHTLVPLLTVGWWLAYAPKDLSLRQLPLWLIWPVIYCTYAVTRGHLTGFWAYPFLDADQVGWPRVAGNISLLVAGFVLVSGAFLALARRLFR